MAFLYQRAPFNPGMVSTGGGGGGGPGNAGMPMGLLLLLTYAS